MTCSVLLILRVVFQPLNVVIVETLSPPIDRMRTLPGCRHMFDSDDVPHWEPSVQFTSPWLSPSRWTRTHCLPCSAKTGSIRRAHRAILLLVRHGRKVCPMFSASRSRFFFMKGPVGTVVMMFFFTLLMRGRYRLGRRPRHGSVPLSTRVAKAR